MAGRGEVTDPAAGVLPEAQRFLFSCICRWYNRIMCYFLLKNPRGSQRSGPKGGEGGVWLLFRVLEVRDLVSPPGTGIGPGY